MANLTLRDSSDKEGKRLAGGGRKEGGDRRNCPTQTKDNEIQTQTEITTLPSHLRAFQGFFLHKLFLLRPLTESELREDTRIRSAPWGEAGGKKAF